MSEHKSSAQIEREIEQERSALTNSLEELQDQFSPERILNSVTEQFRDNGGDVARNIARSAKENPIPLALTGIGLAWLISSSSKSKPREDRNGRSAAETDHLDMADDWNDPHHSRRSARYASNRPTPYGADRAYSRPALDHRDEFYVSPSVGHDDVGWDTDTDSDFDDGPSTWGRITSQAARAHDSAKSHVLDAHGRAMDVASDTADSLSDAASDATDAVKARASATRDGAYEGTAAARDGVTSAARSTREAAASRYAATRDRLQDGIDSAKDEATRRYYQAKMKALISRNRTYMRAAEMRDRISDGTEKMSEEARRRVINARMRAYEIQKSAEHHARTQARKAKAFANDEPLVIGAIALALGAAAGAMLPRTKTENRAIGPYRDRAFDEADRVYREESAKLRKVAEAAADEGKQVVREAIDGTKESLPHGQDAVNKVEAKASDAARRIGDAATEEAEKQDLGKTVSS